MKELPLKGDAGRWMFELHNKVNHKLRTQCRDDSAVTDPGPDPSFEDVRQKYESTKPNQIPGRDFLFSVAVNYPANPSPADVSTQRTFLNKLSKVFPFVTFEKYIESNPPNLESQKTYMKWMYGLLSYLSKKFRATLPSYKGYVQRVMYYKSGCSKKSYKGKTCRRLAGGGFTKNRDHLRTQRVARLNLLGK